MSAWACFLAACPCVRAGELEHSLSRVSVEETRRVVADELRLRGLDQSQLPQAGDIEVPLAVPARTGRTLRVGFVCWDEDAARLRLRLECREAGACLPFLVYVRTASRTEAPSCAMKQMKQRTARSSPSVSPPVVRPGERAVAVLVAAGMRMTAAVTCMDRAARGEVIRVRGEQGRIFRARVAGPALVEALLK